MGPVWLAVQISGANLPHPPETNMSLWLASPIPALEGPVLGQVRSSLNWVLSPGKLQP